MTDSALTISAFTRIVKRTLEDNRELSDIWIIGEISNLTYHSSGHIYFSLKDENSSVNAAFFKYQNKKLPFRLEDGMNVLCRGGVSVYEKRGSYQFLVSELRQAGIGDLQKRIELLKKKLLSEGIFDQKRKRKLPRVPRRLGIVTSPTGAALRDIIKVATRRFPNIEIIIAPTKVQGSEAPESIARAIEIINRPEYGVDVIIAGRGGGSFEDLMPFNEEIVVRAFYHSRVPIVSAVGHQVDHPLSDDAADAYAPTPSAAAEICVPVKFDLVDDIDFAIGRANSAISSFLRERSSVLSGIANKKIFRQPYELITMRELSVADAEKRLLSGMKEAIVSRRYALGNVPSLQKLVSSIIKDRKNQFRLMLQSLENLSPLAVLKRGYSIITNVAGNLVKSVNEAENGDRVNVQLRDGSFDCEILSRKSLKIGFPGPPSTGEEN